MAKFGIFIEPIQHFENPYPRWRWEVRPKLGSRDGFGPVSAEGYEDSPEKAELRGRTWAMALDKKKLIIWDSETADGV